LLMLFVAMLYRFLFIVRIRPPPHATLFPYTTLFRSARGSVRRGSRISALIADTSSSPVNANAICDQKFTVSQLQCGIIFAQVKRSEEHTSELQSRFELVCRLLLEKKNGCKIAEPLVC